MRKFVIGIFGDILSGDEDFSGARFVEASDNIQQRRLATAGRTGDGGEESSLDRERDFAQGGHDGFAQMVFLVDGFEHDQRGGADRRRDNFGTHITGFDRLAVWIRKTKPIPVTSNRFEYQPTHFLRGNLCSYRQRRDQRP